MAEKRKTLKAIINQGKKLFKVIPDAAYVGTFSGEIIARNPAFLELFELQPEDTSKLSLDDLTDDSITRCEFIDLLGKSKDGKITSYEEVLVTSTGQRIICEVTASIMGETDERPGDKYYFGLVRDITRRKRYEEALNQASKMESLGILVGGIAHDFNNLLTGPMGYMDMLMAQASLTGFNPERAIEYAGKSLESLQRARNLVKQLLDYSRPSSTDFEEIELNKHLLDCLTMINEITLKSYDIKTEIDTSELYILGNKSKIHQILQNLVINARDAINVTERRDGEIIVSTEFLELEEALHINQPRTRDDLEVPAGKYVKISVSDNGCGIDAETLQRMYDPFFTTKERGSDTGTGLGLSNVTSLVNAHGGYINVDSRVRRGTTFEIYLPILDPDEINQKSNDTADYCEVSDERSENSYINILIVEDDPVIRELMQHVFESRSDEYQIEFAEDGEEGLEKYNTGEYNLVITDYVMPKMNGGDLIKKIRKQDQDAKVILLTGYNSEDLALGDVVIINKPFKPNTLFETIDTVLSE